MLQSVNGDAPFRGPHVAIIMDGNGRWAERRGWPRQAGHAAGAETVRRIVEAAHRLDVGTLTLYAFSSDNWQRPKQEVVVLFRLLREHLVSEAPRCATNGIRLSIMGRRDRLGAKMLAAIARAEEATRTCSAMHLRIAVDYSARDAIVASGATLAGSIGRREFAKRLGEVSHVPVALDVDLLVRTGGERRLSDFLLWECAYAELWFSDKMWPDFQPADLEHALEDFRGRQRRFGRVEGLVTDDAPAAHSDSRRGAVS